jgi:FkbM family methyltransferase
MQTHDLPLGFRLARAGRNFRNVRGWRRLTSLMAPPSVRGHFRVDNDGVIFDGDVGSFIEREIYLYGGYERDAIALFLSLCAGRRGTILDIGANAGNHSLAFARHFAHVEAFEPNPALWPTFERNVALNAFSNVRLHKVGLGSVAAELPFFNISNGNEGLGTFVTTEQYDEQLEQTGVAQVVVGDDHLASSGIAGIDAIKIDVQGFEREVFLGLRETLARDRPVIWFECAGLEGLASTAQVEETLSYAVDLYCMMPGIAGPLHRTVLTRVPPGPLTYGDYVALPRS